LVVHLANIHSWAATIVETGNAAAEQYDEPGSRKPKAVAEWYAAKAEDLFQVLRTVDPGQPTWNFAFGSGDAAFWSRRQLHETTIHGIDLGLVTGKVAHVDPWVAADGIDEALRVFLHRMHVRGFPADLTAPLSIVATDTGSAWTLRTPRALAGEPEVSEGALDGVDRIEGPAAAVYALLWKRLPTSEPSLNYSGDTGRVERFLASRLTA
jgi:uncharacterized protein (TIGR03083 family)